MNKIQSEAQLENNLISQLEWLEYQKLQIEIHNFDKLNWKDLSDTEFKR